MKCSDELQRFLGRHELGICSLLAGTSFLAFMTLLPLIIDPSIVAFVLHLKPASCLTLYSAEFNGTANCTWTSCQEGCTVDIYKCWHINVSYSFHDPSVAIPNVPYDQARLYPNVVGCGYPPTVDCDGFFQNYSKILGESFPCFVSTSDPSVAVISADLEEAALNISLGFIPLVIFVILMVYITLRVRCKRQQRLLRAKTSESHSVLELEQMRRIKESKRILESRKQSWLNAFRQDRASSLSTSPSSSSTKLNQGLARARSSLDKMSKLSNSSTSPRPTKSRTPISISSVSAAVPLPQLVVNTCNST